MFLYYKNLTFFSWQLGKCYGWITYDCYPSSSLGKLQIDSITIFCIINNTTRTISLTIDGYHTALSIIFFSFLVMIMVNWYLNQLSNPIIEFQHAPTSILLITFCNNNKDLFKVIQEQVYFARKIKVVQTRYLVPHLLKKYWKQDTSLKKFCTVIMSAKVEFLWWNSWD